MFRKECRLIRASKYFMGGGGGGGGGDILMRQPSKESETIANWFNRNIGRESQFASEDQFLGPAGRGALGFFNTRLPQMLGQFPGFQSEIAGNQEQIRGYQGQLGDIYSGLGALKPNYAKFLGPSSALSETYRESIDPVLRSGGALTQQQTNAAVQQARAAASAAGTVRDPSAIIKEYESRQGAKDTRLNQALGQSQSVLGQQAGAVGGMQNILQGQAGVTGQGAGLSALLSSLTGQKAGLLGQEQGLQSGGLNQLLGVGNAAVSQYTNLTNPMLSYLSSLFGGNQQASIANAQIGAQQSAAGDAKMGSTIGGGISAIGSIAAIAL